MYGLRPVTAASSKTARYRFVERLYFCGARKQAACAVVRYGAGEGNRTLVVSLGSFCSTIELHPRTAHSTRVCALLTTFRGRVSGVVWLSNRLLVLRPPSQSIDESRKPRQPHRRSPTIRTLNVVLVLYLVDLCSKNTTNSYVLAGERELRTKFGEFGYSSVD